MSQTTPTNTTLTDEEARLLQLWHKRVASGKFSEGVSGTRTIKVMGRAGDAPVAIPHIVSLAVLDTVSPEEKFAVEYGDRLLDAFRQRGRSVFSNGNLVQRFDPTEPYDLLVLSPLAGGAV